MSTTPPEPTFTLTASDNASLAAMQQYLRKAGALAAPPAFLASLQDQINTWTAWRAANLDQLKTPTGS